MLHAFRKSFHRFLRPNCIIGIINVGDTQYLAFKKVQLNQFFVNSFAYYGLTMNIGDLAADNVYLNFAVSGRFQEKFILTKKQLIERYRTSRNPKLWLGRSHLAVRRAQNSVFRVRVDNFDDNWHTDEKHETTETLLDRYSRSMLLCGISLLSISLVPEGQPTLVLVIALFGEIWPSHCHLRIFSTGVSYFRKDVHHIFFRGDLPVRSRALPNRDQNFRDWFGLFCRQVFVHYQLLSS